MRGTKTQSLQKFSRAGWQDRKRRVRGCHPTQPCMRQDGHHNGANTASRPFRRRGGRHRTKFARFLALAPLQGARFTSGCFSSCNVERQDEARTSRSLYRRPCPSLKHIPSTRYMLLACSRSSPCLRFRFKDIAMSACYDAYMAGEGGNRCWAHAPMIGNMTIEPW